MQNAGLLRRLAAILYDALLMLALLFLATLPFIAMRGGEPVASDDNLAYQLTIVLVVYLFFVGFWTGAGRTLGMQSWGLRLELPDGGRPGLAAATLRFFAACLSGAALGLGFLWSLWDDERLAWHDRLSGTRLVYYPKTDESADAVQREYGDDKQQG
jgi:uncharacterized RDD family membrane protein YckC